MKRNALIGLGLLLWATSTNAQTNLAQEMTIKLGNDVTMEFVLIPAGSFMMGSDTDRLEEAPMHKVTFAKPFYMGRYPVTQEQWETIMGSNPSEFKGRKNPVERLTWFDCQDFVAALKDKLPDRQFSFPTEAQWEYACRAGSTNQYYYGTATNELTNHAWYKPNSDKTTHPVGQKQPNAWGLYDMHGNVWIWCQDVWHKTYTEAPTDGRAWMHGDDTYRVFRGGSYEYDARYLRARRRSFIRPEKAGAAIGLRVVMAAP